MGAGGECFIAVEAYAIKKYLVWSIFYVGIVLCLNWAFFPAGHRRGLGGGVGVFPLGKPAELDKSLVTRDCEVSASLLVLAISSINENTLRSRPSTQIISSEQV